MKLSDPKDRLLNRRPLTEPNIDHPLTGEFFDWQADHILHPEHKPDRDGEE